MKFIIGLVFLGVATFANAFTFTKEFTEAELQQQIEAMMPLEINRFLIRIIITDPELDLIAGANALGIAAVVHATAPGGLQGHGTTRITGTITYSPHEGAFYLSNPRVVALHIQGVDDIYQADIKQLAQITVAELLVRQPVYRLKDDNRQHQLAKSRLESVRVENEKLIVKLKMF